MIRKFQFAFDLIAIPTALITSTTGQTESAGGGIPISWTLKTLNVTESAVDGIYDEIENRFYATVLSPTALSIGGFNGTNRGTGGMVVGIVDPITKTPPTLDAFDVLDVQPAYGSAASATDNSAIASMRANCSAKLATATAACLAGFAVPNLPTTRITKSVINIPTPSEIVSEVPLALPSFALNNDILTALCYGFARKCVAKWKQSHSVKAAGVVAKSEIISGYSHFAVEQQVSVTGLAVAKETSIVTLYVDDVTGQVSMLPLGADDETAVKLAYEEALRIELQAAHRENRPAVLPSPKPELAQTDANLAWSTGMSQLVSGYNTNRVQLIDDAYAAAVAGGETRAKTDWLANMTFEAPTAKTGTEENSPWWKTVLGTLGDATGKVWDTVSDWGPTGLATGYAAVVATNEAKKTGWLVPMAIAGAAILLLK